MATVTVATIKENEYRSAIRAYKYNWGNIIALLDQQFEQGLRIQ